MTKIPPLFVPLAAVLIALCTGATYSWSVFVGPLRAWTGLDQGAVQLPFTLFYIAFPLTLIFAGRVMRRIGPRRSALLGGIIFGGGWMLAGMGARHFAFTAIGIGLLGGVGVGLVYIVPIAICMLWFPKNKGLITGIAVAGFGGGAAGVAAVAERIISAPGATPFSAFGWLGLAFMILIGLGSLAMTYPPPGTDARPPAPLPWRTVLGEPAFWMLYVAMFAGLAAGFAVNSNLKQLYLGLGGTPETGAPVIDAFKHAGLMAVVFFAIANAIGRLAWGWFFDRVRPQTAIRANLAAQGALFAAAVLLLRSPAGLVVFAALVGFNYGGVLVIYASTAAQRWGAARVSQIYGWLFTANIPASLAPILAGKAYAHAGNFLAPLWVLATLTLLAAILLRPRRLAPSKP